MPSRQINSVKLIGNDSQGYPILYAGTEGVPPSSVLQD